jgi:hypothetical protein
VTPLPDSARPEDPADWDLADVLSYVREAIIGAVGDQADALLDRALDAGGGAEKCLGGRELRALVNRFVRVELRAVIGGYAADELVDGVMPIVARVAARGSTLRASTASPPPPTRSEVVTKLERPPEPVPPPPPTGFETLSARWPEREPVWVTRQGRGLLPVVLISSANLDRVGELNRLLNGLASVGVIEDAVELIDTLRDCSEHHPVVVVLDCTHPIVRAGTLVAVANGIPDGARVLLWGPSPTIEVEVARMRGGSWLCCSASSPPEHVASLAAALAAR